MLFAISVAFLYLIINVVAFTNHAFLHCAAKSGWSHRRPHLPSKEGTVDNTHVNDYTGIINMGKEKKETRRECFEGRAGALEMPSDPFHGTWSKAPLQHHATL